MCRIIVEHEDVGAWTIVNSTFLSTRYYEVKPSGEAALVDRPGAGHSFSVDTAPELGRDQDRQRGLLFQLGTFEEDHDGTGPRGEGPAGDSGSAYKHRGAHTDFEAIEINIVGRKEPVCLKRGEVFWVNVLDNAVKTLAMNPFHALYFWPVACFRGAPYRAWRKSPPNDQARFQRSFADKRLHPRLRLDGEVRRPSGSRGPHGALLTYWNGGSRYTITVEHHQDAAWGAPTHLRYVIEFPSPVFVDVYSAPQISAVDVDPSDSLSPSMVRQMINHKPASRHTDVSEILIKATPWTGEWTHGGVHDGPWTKP